MKPLKLFMVLFTILFSFSCKEKEKKKENPMEKQYNSRSKNVTILKDSLGVKNLQGEVVYRAVWLYLPPNYETSSEKYPVIYMHDGQNLFDKETSYAGEWGVDEILNNVFEKTGKGFIVVGINNVGNERMNEYSPWKHEKYGGGSGDHYLEAVVSVLKPTIDRNYRTKPEAAYTGIMGSSMGGLISYYAGLKHPDIFGNIGVLSPSFWFSKDVLGYTKERAKKAKNKMFFLLGEEEGMTKEFDEVSSLLIESGFKSDNLAKKLVPKGKHNEVFWNSQFEEVITWLYNIE